MNLSTKNRREKENYLEMTSILELGVLYGSINAMYTLGEYYREKGNVPEMLLYYEMAKSKNDKNSIDKLAFYYKETKQFELMLENFYLSMKLGSTSGLQYVADYYREIGEENIPILFDYYQILNETEESNIKNSKSDIISWVCNEMDSELLTPIIINYCVKENHDFIFELAKRHPDCGIFSEICLSLPNEEEGNECPICYRSEKKIFPYDCFRENRKCKSHLCCIDCYVQIDKCHICRGSKNRENILFCNIIPKSI